MRRQAALRRQSFRAAGRLRLARRAAPAPALRAADSLGRRREVAWQEGYTMRLLSGFGAFQAPFRPLEGYKDRFAHCLRIVQNSRPGIEVLYAPTMPVNYFRKFGWPRISLVVSISWSPGIEAVCILCGFWRFLASPASPRFIHRDFHSPGSRKKTAFHDPGGRGMRRWTRSRMEAVTRAFTTIRPALSRCERTVPSR